MERSVRACRSALPSHAVMLMSADQGLGKQSQYSLLHIHQGRFVSDRQANNTQLQPDAATCLLEPRQADVPQDSLCRMSMIKAGWALQLSMPSCPDCARAPATSTA